MWDLGRYVPAYKNDTLLFDTEHDNKQRIKLDIVTYVYSIMSLRRYIFILTW